MKSERHGQAGVPIAIKPKATLSLKAPLSLIYAVWHLDSIQVRNRATDHVIPSLAEASARLLNPQLTNDRSGILACAEQLARTKASVLQTITAW
jgi:hypothetical protein